MVNLIKARWGRIFLFLLSVFVLTDVGFEVNAVAPRATSIRGITIKGTVTDTQGRPQVGAKVYFIDSSTVNTTPITQAAIRDGTAEAYDEPLEDIVRDPVTAAALPQAITNTLGQFAKVKLNGSAKFYAFVMPVDSDHLPGGSASRIAFSPKSVGRAGLKIQISWTQAGFYGLTPGTAYDPEEYIGASACLVCHGPGGSAPDVSACKKHGHALMYVKPGQPTANQNPAGHPGVSWTSFTDKFTPAAAYTASGVKKLYLQDYLSTDSSNPFVIYEDTKLASGVPARDEVYMEIYLWKSSVDGKYKVTFKNLKVPAAQNPSVPGSAEWTVDLALTFGGYIRQRLVVDNIGGGRKGIYRIFQYQAIPGSTSQGLLTNYDRARKPYAVGGSGGGGLLDFYPITTTAQGTAFNLRLPPPSATSGLISQMSCAICHLGAGTAEKFNDPITAETLIRTVSDPNGAYDTTGGLEGPQDIGVSCEQCHGPGKKHREEALRSLVGDNEIINSKAYPRKGKYIVNPKLLGSDRASLICGRCHTGGNSLNNEETQFPPPGISRNDYMTNYVKPASKGLSTSSLWPDQIHATGGHHGSTYSHYLLSKHMRNSRHLVGCDDCHDSMGNSTYRFFLKGDPDDSSTSASLCLQCHAKEVVSHMQEKTGAQMSGTNTACVTCHMTRVGKGAAGRPGLLLGTPTGTSTDANLYYWEGDQASHVFDVVNKFDRGVAGVVPALAMPSPYTNSCGTCHDASTLPYQAPNP